MMVQTRGRKTLALRHAGGWLREIETSAIVKALQSHKLPHEEEVVTRISDLLRERLVTVDLTPAVLRGSEKEIERIEKAAKEMLAAIRGYRDFGDLSLSIDGDMAQTTGEHEGSIRLFGWLLRLSKARERYFREYNPSGSYHSAIKKIRGIISDAGGNVAVHKTSQFVLFLSELERMRPAMIFPPETVETGRARYVENALRSDSSN
ncbi:hypothetical protein [Paracoccus salsus]|uniref:hypothetical protein n=1 Tax=Paracoccus salsus TaxID=2911061 RepID=UPI001F345083|nr:hypothetical protein [Paracoccus salsus]MCF3973998.1 hypothetical protein [Paracoccus salsus]